MAVIAVAGAGAVLTLVAPGDNPIACPADGRIGAPDGWSWQRDAGNDCAWTLYDSHGNAAPTGIYVTNDETAPPTSDAGLLVTTLVFLAVVTVASRVALVVWRTRDDTPTS